MQDFDAGGMYSVDHLRGFVAVELHQIDARLTHTLVDCLHCRWEGDEEKNVGEDGVRVELGRG